MRPTILLILMVLFSFKGLKGQDTFSILAFDSISGEVGGAGASCVDLFSFPGFGNDFIIELFPGVGGIATQASYLAANQQNARARMNAGDSPKQLIAWLRANDVQQNPSVRQYGVVRMMKDSIQSAAHTGTACLNYKNHISGPNYSIQGNILLGPSVLDSMEARFLREPGDLACKLMAAMQGAKMIGADTRCAGNQTSSLFAFLKVSSPNDVFGNPSFLISLKTHANDGLEPIDSLQTLFDMARTCTVSTLGVTDSKAVSFMGVRLLYHAVSEHLVIEALPGVEYRLTLFNVLGETLLSRVQSGPAELSAGELPGGLVVYKLERGGRVVFGRILLH